MYKRILYTFLVAIFIIGCAPEPEPEPEVVEAPPPPPPTPEEIAAKIINELQLNQPLPPSDFVIPPELVAGMKAAASNQKAMLSATEDGKKALAIVSQQVDSRLRQSFNSEVWSLTLALSDLHTILNPGSVKFDGERIRAIAELSRPVVVIKGIVNDGTTGRPFARLEITLPLEGRTVTETMKQDEQLYGIRFVEVIGNSHGIVFEYRETGELFDVLTNAASK